MVSTINMFNKVISTSKRSLVIGTCVLITACNNAKPIDIAAVPTPESASLHRVPLEVIDKKQPSAAIQQTSGLTSNVKTSIAKPNAELALIDAETSDKTKFSSAAFGVKGSPRVTTKRNVRKGGGRNQIGKPYTIRGKKYYPRLDPNLKQTGLASWYGPNFHGRLTANGEVYDQYALSAAHPTMPLPSYAKVTNLENGSSVTVRVNDRGPFSKNRVIDLSARAAKFLGYTKQGVAKVKVEYVGKAPLHGLDEKMLLATYNPGGVNPATIPNVPGIGGNQVVAQNIQKPIKNAPVVTTIPQISPVRANNIPRPAGLINSFAAQQNSTLPFDQAFDFSTDNQLIKTPSQGMNNLVHLTFGPFATYKTMQSAEKILSNKGIVQQIEQGQADEKLLLVITAEEDVNAVLGLTKEFKIKQYKAR